MRKRATLDMQRLRLAQRGPGADTRVWLATARVDDDPDALEWDAELGWLVDVTFYGDPLDGEGPCRCRLGSLFAGAEATKQDPPARGCEVLVLIPGGDPNANPVIVGRVHNADDCSPPATVGSDPITEALALANHLVVTPHGAREQYGGDRLVTAPNQELTADVLAAVRAPAIEFGATPTDPAVLGAQLVTQLNALSTALSAYALAIGPPGPPVALTTATTNAAGATLITALGNFQSALAQVLSQVVKLQ